MIAIVVASFAMTSCLDKEPESAIPLDQAMQSFEDAEQTVTGIYAMLKSSALFSGYLTLLPDIQTDLVYAVDGYTNVYGNFWQWDVRPTNAEIESVYAGLYSVISNCNFYLERIDNIMQMQTDDNRITTLEFYTGEVYTIRALAYSELLKNFCKAYDPATAKDELVWCFASTIRWRSPHVAHRFMTLMSSSWMIWPKPRSCSTRSMTLIVRTTSPKAWRTHCTPA